LSEIVLDLLYVLVLTAVAVLALALIVVLDQYMGGGRKVPTQPVESFLPEHVGPSRLGDSQAVGPQAEAHGNIVDDATRPVAVKIESCSLGVLGESHINSQKLGLTLDHE
jgi:hypothetical protein